MLQNVKCELTLISDFVYRRIHLHPEQVELFFKENQEEKAQLYFNTEIRRILTVIKDTACMIRKRSHRKNYRRTQFLETIELHDTLQMSLTTDDENPMDERCASIYQIIVEGLEEILKYLNKSRMFNAELDFQLPYVHYCNAATQIKQQLLLLSEKMDDRDVSDRLHRIIKQDVLSFCEMGYCTYRELKYMEHLMAKLLALFETSNSLFENWTWRVGHLLVSMNFNTAVFIEYCWNDITADVDKEKNLRLQEIRFKFHRKEIEKQMTYKAVYRIKGLSVKQALLVQVQNDLDYIDELNKSVTGKDHPRIDFTARHEEELLDVEQAMDYLHFGKSTFYRKQKLENWKQVEKNGKVYYKKSTLTVSHK
jgi:hypothetical protein